MPGICTTTIDFGVLIGSEVRSPFLGCLDPSTQYPNIIPLQVPEPPMKGPGPSKLILLRVLHPVNTGFLGGQVMDVSVLPIWRSLGLGSETFQGLQTQGQKSEVPNSTLMVQSTQIRDVHV